MQRSLSLVATLFAALFAALFATPTAFAQSYTDDFQSYGEHANPPGWVDTSVGSSKPDASGLYKTWGDPTQGNKATNVVFGTKQSSGKADPNGRMGTFSTYTTKTFSGAGRFEYRGRFIRTNNDSRVGLTFFSSYPEKDQYYLAGLMPQSNGTLTMQLLSFGAGTLTGTIDSRFTPNANQWYWFAIQGDAIGSETHIRARFWVDGSTEPSSWTIDAVDTSAARLTAGRIGIWAAIKGDAYVDDLSAKSAVDHTAPAIAFFESNSAMTDNQVFNRAASPDIRVSDDSSGVGSVVIKLDGEPYVSKTLVSTERYHQLDVDAIDVAGNSAHATIHFAIDETAPVVSILDRGTAMADGAVLNHDVAPVISVTDLTPVTTTVTLDGAPFIAGAVVSAEARHTISVSSTDSAHHTTTRSVAFTIDKRAPSLTLTSAKDGDVVTDTTIVLSGAADDSVRVTVNGIPAQLNTATATWTSAPITLVEGKNPIAVAGIDNAGNNGQLAVTISLDTRAPQLIVSAPDANACINTTVVDLHGTVSDAHPKDVTVQFGGNNITAHLDSTGAWSANVSDVPEGKAVFLITATDTVGHTTTVSRSVNADRTDPVIEVSESGAPFTAKLINRPVSLDVRVVDADENPALTVTLDGGATGASPVAVSAEGAHILDGIATDCAGQRTERKVTFTIDRTAPALSGLAPADGATIGAAPASIHGNSSEAATITVAGTALAASLTAAGPFDFAGATFVEGLNRFTLHAVDDAGNSADLPYSFTLRTTTPSIDITENGSSIANNSLFNRSVTPVIRISVSDAAVNATLDGQPFTSGTTVAAEGAHTLSVNAIDPVGHTATASVAFTIDVTAPIIKINAPATGAKIDADRVTVSGNAGDASSLTVNGISVTPAGGGAFSTTIPLDLGENLIVAAGRDRAGNNAADQITVTRSDAGTGIFLTSPADGSSTNRRTTVVSGRILTPANASSLRIGTINVSFDPAGNFTIPDFALVEGINTITATLTSTNGKTTSATVTITSDLTPPTVRILALVGANAQPLEDDARFPSSVSLTVDATGASSIELRVDGSAVTTPFAVSATGAHTAIATATDAAGNQARVRRYFAIGAQAGSGCSLGDFDPSNGSVVAAPSVTITGTTGGAAGVKVNGVPAAVANGSFSGTAELSVEGSNVITIVCTDAAGTTVGTSSTLTLIRATNAPSVTITSPAEMAVTGAAKITVSGTIGEGVESVTVNGAAATITGTSFTADVNLGAGLNVLAARAKNGAGRYGTASRRVVSLQNAPTIGIDWPNDGFSTSATAIDVAGTYTNLDPATIASSAGGILETHPGSDTSGSYVIHGVVLSGGSQAVTVTGHDAVARSVNAKVNVSLDSNAPSIVIASPADGSYSLSSTVAVSGSVTAVTGSRVDIGNTPGTISGTTFSGNATLGSGAATPVVARVTQPDGSSAIATSYVTLLNAAPAVARIFPSADAVAVDSGVVVNVAFSAPMNRASLDAGVVLLDGSGAEVTGQRRLDVDVLSFAPATTLTPGQRYTVVVKTSAKDLAGNAIATEQRSSFTIATSAPSTAPQVDAIASPVCASSITIGGTAPASSRLEISISGVPQFTTADASGRFSAQLAIPAQSGFRVARVRIIGGDGSYSPTAQAGFQVDCAGPVVNGATYDRNANSISVTFSKPIDLGTAAGAISLKLADGTAVTSTVAAGTANTIVITPGSPDPRAQTLVLTISTSIKDTTGRALAATFSQTFTIGGTTGGPANGSGFISGQILDATNGRPLAGVNVAITPTTPAIAIVSDSNGQYASAVVEGAYTIHAYATGYTDVWRQVVVPAGSGIVPIDIRLTARGSALTHGGDDAITRKATLTGSTGSVTSVGSQSLAGLLPLGWSPIAAAEVRSTAGGVATLAFDLPSEAATSGRPFTAVEYDAARDEWRVLQASVAITGNSASFSIGVGQAPSPVAFALVYPDALSGLAAPAVPVAGQVLTGVQDPCATQTCATLATKSFPLTPTTVLPNGRTVATLNMEGSNNPYPSGTAVQAFVNEELTLLNGSVDTAQPFSTDLILYRSLDGTTSSAAFHLAPSAHAGAVPLQVGFDRISVFPYPGRLDRGTLVGPAGGPIPSDDKVQIDIPTGAAPSALHATATSITDFSPFTVPGFDVVGGFTLALTDSVQLLKPANVTLTIDAANSHAQLIVAEVVAGTPYGRIFRMVANTTAPQPIASTTKVRVATAAIDPSTLPLDGVVRPGQYLLLLAKQPIAFAFGFVRLGPSGGYVNSAGVTASPLGVADVTRPSGLFTIPVVAKPAASFSLTPSLASTGTGVAYSAPAVDAGLPIAIGDLVLRSQPPVLQHLNVIATGGGLDLVSVPAAREVSLTTNVQAVFSQTIDASSITPSSITVTDASGTAIAGSVTAAGATLTWSGSAQLAPNAGYVITISGDIRSFCGGTGALACPLGTSQSFAFSTVTQLTNAQINAAKIHITIPDANGVSTIFGDPRALPTVPPEPRAWRAVALRRGNAFTSVFQATAANDGSFSFTINPVALTDHIDLEILNAADNVAAILPLGPFSSADGQAFVAQPDASLTFTSRDGVAVTVPAGSFDEPTTIAIRRLDTDAALANVPNIHNELNFTRGVQLDFSCAPCTSNNRIDVTIPVPAAADPSRNYLLGWLGTSVRGPRVMVVDTLRIDGGNFTTAAANGGGLRAQTQSAKRIGSQQVLTQDDVKKYLFGVQNSGVYAVVDLVSAAGYAAGWTAIDGLTGNFDLFSDQFLSLFASREYLAESRGRIIMPVLPGRRFELVGVDAGTGLQAFSKVYDPLPVSDGGTALVIASPQSELAGPYPVFATPVRVETIEVSKENVDITSIPNFSVRLAGGSIAVTNGDGPLPGDVEASLLDVNTGSYDPLRSDGLSVGGPAKPGDRIVLMVEQRDVDPTSSLSVVFSCPIYSGTLASADDVNSYLHSVVKLQRAPRPIAGAQPQFSDMSQLARFTLDSQGRRLVITLPSELERGAVYRLDLGSDLSSLFGSGPGLKLGQVKTQSGVSPPLPEGIRLLFRVRDVPDPLTSFDIRQDANTSIGAIRDLSLNGNVLLMSAATGGILAYDVADPASLTSTSVPIGYVKPDSNEFWAVASDQHGRVYTTGTNGIFSFVQSYRLDDFIGTPQSPNVITAPRSGMIVGWVPGSTSGIGVSSETVLSDRPEGLPRKLQLGVQDTDLRYDNLTDFTAGLVPRGGSATVTTVGDFRKLKVTIPRENGFPYRTQRITIENLTRDMRWSGDAVDQTAAVIDNIIAQQNDQLRLVINERTYGVVTIFGYGVGIFDLNAAESNDLPNPPSTYKPISERVRLTHAELNADCQGLGPNPDAIQDLGFSPEIAVVPQTASNDLVVYGADVHRGVLDVKVSLNTTAVIDERPVCDNRNPLGLLLTPSQNSRIAQLDSLFSSATGRHPFGRFGGVQTYHWILEASDNKALAPAQNGIANLGQRGSVAGTRVERDYLLVPGNEYGLLIVDATKPEGWLRDFNLADIVWIPGGAVAVRVIPRTHYATVVDGAGRVLLVDLGHIDQRWSSSGIAINQDALFPSALAALQSQGSYGVGAADPRILWTSAPGVVHGALAPVIDTDTGFLFAGQLQEKTATVVAIGDPRIELRVDTGYDSLAEVGGIVPLGIEPPAKILKDGDPNASLAAFRLELTLPGGIAEKLAGSKLRLAIESERVPGAPVEQTPAGFPRAHLRATRTDGSPETRPVPDFYMQRNIPAGMEQVLRRQKGFNKFVSPWIVAIADPRASESYTWIDLGTRSAAGCFKCARPERLAGRTELEGVWELWSGGRDIAIRPEVCGSAFNGCTGIETIFSGTKYAYLGEAGRLTARFPTVMADSIRMPSFQVPAHGVPLAEGVLQERTYVHSGEVETVALDLDAGGRNGWDVAIGRTYRSRTIGGSAFGAGWESNIFKHLRPLPNGDVEYRDGMGEEWTFTLKGAREYTPPAGLFLKLTRTDNGWRMFDQRWRFAHFDSLGRLVAESDEFANPGSGVPSTPEGNVTWYLYDKSGRLAQIVDPVGRATNISWWRESDTSQTGAVPGLVKEITDWRDRKVSYAYDALGRLVSVRQPQVDNPSASQQGVFSGRAETQYTYQQFNGSSFTQLVDFSANLKSIKDPVAVAAGGGDRVTFNYNVGVDLARRDRVESQAWATGEQATFEVTEAGTALPTKVAVTDAVGQKREYTLTAPFVEADRRTHIRETTLDRVPVLEHEASNATAQASLTDEATLRNLVSTVVSFDADGESLVTKLPNGRVVTMTPEDATGGAAGKRVKAIEESAPNASSITTTPKYDDLEGSSNTPVSIARSAATPAPTDYRDRATASRKRRDVTVNDDDVKSVETRDESGQLKKMAQQDPNGGNESSVEEYTYYDESATRIARGRIHTVTRPDRAVSVTYSYKDGSAGGDQITIEDNARITVTTIDRDAMGRVVHRVITDSSGTLSDESYGYDANGQLTFVSRQQKNLGAVISRMTYDAMLRPKDQSVSNAVVNGAATTVTTTTKYDLPNRTITRSDPYVGSTPTGASQITTLDGLGRLMETKRISSDGAKQQLHVFRYDTMGALSYESDRKRTAVVHVQDVFGRTVLSVDSEMLRHESTWDAWGQSSEERSYDAQLSLQGGAPQLTGRSRQLFTHNGQLRAVNEELIGGAQYRQTRYGWENGGRKTNVRTAPIGSLDDVSIGGAVTSRMSENELDTSGRLLARRLGEGVGISGSFTAQGLYQEIRTDSGEFRGMQPLAQHELEPRAGSAPLTTAHSFDGLDRELTTIAPGGYTVDRTLDEAGNTLTTKVSGHKTAAQASYDSRGLATVQTHPDGKKIALKYDVLGNLVEYKDESDKSTTYETDGLGRVVKTKYSDGTCEATIYEDLSGFMRAKRDRAGQWLVYRYLGSRLDAILKGPVGEASECSAPVPATVPAATTELINYVYDLALHLKSIQSADAGVEFDDYDFAGRPHTTRSVRYRTPAGQSLKETWDVHTQRHVWSIFGERERYRMPVPGTTIAQTAAQTGWRSWIEEKHDPVGNIASQRSILSETQPPVGALITQSYARSVGRLAERRRFLGSSGSSALDTFYGYAEPVATPSGDLPSVPNAPAPYSGLLGRADFAIGDATLAGNVITRDSTRRIVTEAPSASKTRVSSFNYDDRDRLMKSVLNAVRDGADQPTVTESPDPADFRSSRSVMRLTTDERTKLGAATARAVELPSFTATQNDAHQIATVDFDGQTPPDLNFAFSGGRRTADGTWTAKYDVFGRLVQLTRVNPQAGLGNRYEYDYNPQNRMVGRRVCSNRDDQPCVIETDTNVLTRDGLPAETTFVWDPLSDRLLSIFEAGKSLAATSESAGLLRQYVHGDQSYDDPVEVLTGMTAGGAPTRYLPAFDEAGTGNLTAVFNDDGTLAERVLYGDSYGAAPRYLQGPVVERMTRKVTKDQQGKVTGAELTVTLSEAIVPASIATGVHLRSVRPDGSIAVTSIVQPAIDSSNPQIVRWTLTEADWTTLTGSGATAIEIAVTNTLRATGWGQTPVTPPPAWLRQLTAFRSTATEPVIASESISTIAASTDEEPLFEIRDLYLVASDLSKSRLFTGFKASPFIDPGTSFAYSRARWYDAGTGTWLADDQLGYADSSNAYAALASDPVNRRDPSGNSATVVGGLAGLVIGSGSAISSEIGDCFILDECKDTSHYLNQVWQFGIAGAEVGASIEFGGVGGGSLGFVLGGAGVASFKSAQSGDWERFGASQASGGIGGLAAWGLFRGGTALLGMSPTAVAIGNRLASSSASGWLNNVSGRIAGYVARDLSEVFGSKAEAVTGIGSGDLDPVAEQMYEAIRSRGGADIPEIARNSGLPREVIEAVHRHLFLEEHEIALGPGTTVVRRFDAFRDIAESWNRAGNGPLSQEEATVFGRLVAHEYVEHSLMRAGFPYRSAAAEAWSEDNISRAFGEYLGAHDLAPLGDPSRAPFAHWIGFGLLGRR